MRDVFRIHGDNIVECERIARLIIQETKPEYLDSSLISPSTIVYNLEFQYLGYSFSWQLELLPGFNKAGRHRWDGDIFDALRNNGSFLDETPDAIVSHVENGMETILYAIEFCSALQAGNQAWQRSGRAYSTGRTGCPYLYIVDFVKYELDPHTRKRKALRFPNPVVPYSYINFTKDIENFVAQVYVRSEEFDKYQDVTLQDFDENNFAENELKTYIVKRMAGLDTLYEEDSILQKNFNVVLFLAQKAKSVTSFTVNQWKRLFTYQKGILEFSLEYSQFNFHKTITAKGHHGKSLKFLELVDSCSIGLASRDLPFGIIPSANRRKFADGMKYLYPNYDLNILSQIGNGNSDMVLCIMKGFKPRGDDNRPDRGILPLAVMLSSANVEIMTYIYGPVIERNLDALMRTPKRLANANGLWKSILSLSNYVALDVPVLCGRYSDAELLLDTSELKEHYTSENNNSSKLTRPVFSSVPLEYHEDDVDTGIHFLFSHLLELSCFESMCNPPGGDWSGFSVLYDRKEVRWLSLPRVSEKVNGKRPDHILELFGVFDKPLLLSIESKERSCDLEFNVGDGLKNYICSLMSYVPSVERSNATALDVWHHSYTYVSFSNFEILSAAAYLRNSAQANIEVFENSNCDMLFIMNPMYKGWSIEIVTRNRAAQYLKEFIVDIIGKSGFDDITIL